MKRIRATPGDQVTQFTDSDYTNAIPCPAPVWPFFRTLPFRNCPGSGTCIPGKEERKKGIHYKSWRGRRL